MLLASKFIPSFVSIVSANFLSPLTVTLGRLSSFANSYICPMSCQFRRMHLSLVPQTKFENFWFSFLKWILCTHQSSYVECIRRLTALSICYQLTGRDVIVLWILVNRVTGFELDRGFSTSPILPSYGRSLKICHKTYQLRMYFQAE